MKELILLNENMTEIRKLLLPISLYFKLKVDNEFGAEVDTK